MKCAVQENDRSMEAFFARFPNEDACRDFLFEVRWPDGFTCPACGSRRHWFIRTRGLFECKDCRRQTSLTAGTVMEKTRTPLKRWFAMMYLLSDASSGQSILRASRQTGIPYKTAWFMAQKIRAAMSEQDKDRALRGFVELDEAYFGGKKKAGKSGRGAVGKAPVLVGVAVRDGNAGGPGAAVMRVLPNTRTLAVKRAVEKMVAPGSVVLTDGAAAYEKALTGCTHVAVPVIDPKTAHRKLP